MGQNADAAAAAHVPEETGSDSRMASESPAEERPRGRGQQSRNGISGRTGSSEECRHTPGTPTEAADPTTARAGTPVTMSGSPVRPDQTEQNRAWAAVLFDLDGTLLDIDGEGFLDAYVEALTAAWGTADTDAFRRAVMAAAVPIFAPHPSATNGEVFRAHLAEHLGIETHEVRRRIAEYHSRGLQALRYPARQLPEARRCIRRCLDLGLRVAVATTPIYMPEVVRLRLRWAGLEDIPWDLVTHSENMRRCKPDAGYFAEAAALLRLPPGACVMVGDDPLQDGPARQAGMTALLRAGNGTPGWENLEEVCALVAAGAQR